MNNLSKIFKSAATLLAGRPIGRYWHLWERSCGFGGSTDKLFLCAAISEKVSDEDWYPGPSALGPVLGCFRLSEDSQGLRSWSILHSKAIDRATALKLLFENHPWTEIIKSYPELED